MVQSSQDTNTIKDNQQKSPEVLVGQNSFAIYYRANINPDLQLDYSPEWSSRPSADSRILYNPSGFPRTQTNIGFLTNDEAPFALEKDYATKSMMSTDGIFSPISFYPTPYNATFHITKYFTPCCPFCNGTRTYTYFVNPDLLSINLDGINSIDNQTKNTKQKPCPFCEPTQQKTQSMYKSAGPRESSPPFIVASGKDLEIISQLNNTSGASGMPIVNYSTLNPFILSSGEFSNYNKQSGDYTGFSIDLVAHSNMPPRSGDGLRPLYSTNIFNAYSDRDLILEAWVADIRSKGIPVPALPPSGRKNNIRSFALRGPVMLHSWGYDLDGFPVPNASGEPLVRGNTIVRDENNNIVGKNQKQVPLPNGRIGWSKPYKENTFYKGWGQMPGTWPVGPIDFRWDENAKVWTVGSNYKPVFVALEEDLVNREPIRASILDSSQSDHPLPSGLRKLVFVRDPIGSFSAPRGAVVYCRYDSVNGFYEPIARSAYVTSGIISSANTANIYKIYNPIPDNVNIDLSQTPEVEQYQTLYSNPLNYPIKPSSIGLFVFIGSGWVLQSIRC